MTNYICPVPDCDFGSSTDKTKSAVRNHITNTKDESHDNDLEATPKPADGGSETGSDEDGDEEDESEITENQQESTDEGDSTPADKTTVEGGSDGGETTDAEEDMASDEEISTLATTYHGDGFSVVWLFQRFAKLDKDILSCCTASMLGGFQTTNDIDQLDTIEYDSDVHLEQRNRVPSLPDELCVDGQPLALRRWEDDDENTVGSEWIYTDGQTTQRLDSREFDMESTHYGSDRKRINHPF